MTNDEKTGEKNQHNGTACGGKCVSVEDEELLSLALFLGGRDGGMGGGAGDGSPPGK